MPCQAPAGKWVDKVGPGIPVAVALVMQAAALAWIGLFFGPETTLTDTAIPLVLMGVGDGISLPACFTAGTSGVDAGATWFAPGVRTSRELAATAPLCPTAKRGCTRWPWGTAARLAGARVSA
jgi:hypothetical protein